MNILLLNAEWCKSTPKWFAPVVEAPVIGTTFKNRPIAGVAHVNAWNGEYSSVSCSVAQFRWDSITAGYGFVSDVASLSSRHKYDIIRIAVARANWLDSALNFSTGANGPTLKSAFYFIDSTEAGSITFIAGQAMANFMARSIWNVPRLFHRNLFAPLLIGTGYAALPHNAGADYICEVPFDPPGVYSSIEAKGRNLLFNPDTSESARLFLEEGLLQASRNGFIPRRSAFALTTLDASLPSNLLVGQFWDPLNSEATEFNKNFTNLLRIKYFEAIHRFLNAFDRPEINTDNRDELVWDLRPVGFRVGMGRNFYERIIRAIDGYTDPTEFSDWLSRRDAEFKAQLIEGRQPIYNQDGLSLTWLGYRNDS